MVDVNELDIVLELKGKTIKKAEFIEKDYYEEFKLSFTDGSEFIIKSNTMYEESSLEIV